jgi:hypothetical protein
VRLTALTSLRQPNERAAMVWFMAGPCRIKDLNQKRESEAKEKDAEIEILKQQNDSLTER